MKNKITKRVIEEATYMMETEDTIRNVAKKYKVSKSTVHKDLNERLLDIDKIMYQKINQILLKHIHVRHIRGGESTRLKYLNLKHDLS